MTSASNDDVTVAGAGLARYDRRAMTPEISQSSTVPVTFSAYCDMNSIFQDIGLMYLRLRAHRVIINCYSVELVE